ncbi:hypothetical protein ScPMuIL_001490 [Solemya velum]
MVLFGESLFLAVLSLAALGSAEFKITRHPRNMTVFQKQRCTLHCEATGADDYQVNWYHNNKIMSKKGMNYRITRRGGLRYNMITVQDRGVYHCMVRKGDSEFAFSRKAYVVVHASVEIIVPRHDANTRVVEHNQPVQLLCQAVGIPLPSILWRENGKEITNPQKDVMEINRVRMGDEVLKTSLYIYHMTKNATYECEAYNQHILGNTSKKTVINIIILRKPNYTCRPYNGSVCKKILGNRPVFFNSSLENPESEEEVRAGVLISEMLTSNMSSVYRCKGRAEQLICNYVFPTCEEDDIWKTPRPLCRESCLATKELWCFQQWIFVKSYLLPDCEALPSRRNTTRPCNDAGMFERRAEFVRSDCYVGTGRWYNGTVNVTRSGIACQNWKSDVPQEQDRHPDIFPELENSENYCRNPGSEESSPWCYTMDRYRRWEFCDIPKCYNETFALAKPRFALTAILIITVVASVGVFVVGLLFILCYQICSQHRKIKYASTPQDDLVDIDIEKLPPNMSYHMMDERIKLSPRLEGLEYPRNDIVYICDIGQGAFGRVFKAKAPNLFNSDFTLMAVKMLKEDASDDLHKDFEREASLMAEFEHPNIVKLLGVCGMGKPMCLLFEYMSKGDLNEFLRLCSPEQYIIRRHSRRYSGEIFSEDIPNLDNIEQLYIAKQIASGMMYLSTKGYVHRDLATRNCLVSNDLNVKISDFGLARSVHSIDYYKGNENDAIPIRWMPLEAILYNKFTVESDVWSFGIVLWEIFSFALQPYYGMTHEEVVTFIKEGNVLACPENTSQQVYAMMQLCWCRKPNNRPPFQTLHKSICSLHEELLKLKKGRESA